MIVFVLQLIKIRSICVNRETWIRILVVKELPKFWILLHEDLHSLDISLFLNSKIIELYLWQSVFGFKLFHFHCFSILKNNLFLFINFIRSCNVMLYFSLFKVLLCLLLLSFEFCILSHFLQKFLILFLFSWHFDLINF